MSDRPVDAPPRRHRVRIVVAVVGAVVVAAMAAFVVLWNRSGGEQVSMDEARRRAGGAGMEGEAAPPAPLLPAAGVYRYRGEGVERLDKPPLSQAQGPDIPGTLTHLEGGCWRLRVDYSTNHWQSWDYCPTDSGLVEQAGSFWQRLDLVVTQVDTTSSYTCSPPVDAIRVGAQAGDEWAQECRGTSSGSSGEIVSAGPYRFVGPEELEIGGSRVAALHYLRSRALSGGQSGTEDVDVWFDAETGMPLRNRRAITVRSDSLIGGVTYSEEGEFTLVSLSPS